MPAVYFYACCVLQALNSVIVALASLILVCDTITFSFGVPRCVCSVP